MMRTKMITCAMALALVAVAAVGAASATAKEVVFEVNGSPLPPGTLLHGLTLNAEVHDIRGTNYCDGWFEGEILENPGGTFEILESKFFYPDKEEKTGCFLEGVFSPSPLGLIFAEPVTLQAGEEGEVSGSTPGAIDWRGCEYAATFMSSAFEAEGETILHMSGGEFVEECLEGAIFEADFRLSANGEPVTIDVI